MFNFLKRKSKPSVDRNKDITSMAAWESRGKVEETPPAPEFKPEIRTPDAVEAKPKAERKAREPGSKREPKHHAGMDEVLDALKAQAPEVFKIVEVVGSWLWIQDSQCPGDPGTLALLHSTGFRHNANRGVFQNPCGLMVRKSPLGTPELKAKYSVVSAPEYVGAEE